ncbi:hypothetical protein [Psychromicrobium xiongbiense]|uniref:hypothetical protein n=1 Tax=Psychromicrobium xiongbiense TaxID=3051184 RepID=UPI002553B651|nr:hypothetical protein [Psychromicrobium sp. YIM S02556]
MDLYLVGDRYLRFDFGAAASAAVAIVLPGIDVRSSTERTNTAARTQRLADTYRRT